MCIAAALSLASCLDDDDDDNNSTELTAEQIRQCFNTTRGSYSGKVYFPKNASLNGALNTDSADMRWSITSDSTMVMHIPSAVIASAFTNQTLKDSIAKQPEQTVNCYISYVQATPTIGWLINPQPVTYNDITYNGRTSQVQVEFYLNTYYSFGEYSTTGETSQLHIVIGSANIDGQHNSSVMPQAIPLTIYQR